MKTDEFRDKVVIVTGSSSGIGRALAYKLADQGASVALAARNAERLEAVAESCRERGGKALVVPTDVSQEAQCEHLVTRTLEHYGYLDMLINNAGFGVVSYLADLPDLKLFEEVVNVNFFGAVYCAYYALPHLQKTGGRIVAVSSLGGKVAVPGNTAYIASKHAMIGFFDSLRIELELAESGVSVTVICPDWVVTEFHERLLRKDGTPVGEAGRKTFYTETMMTAETCAEVILKAAARRKREVLMGLAGKAAVWVKLLAPGLLDHLAVRHIRVDRKTGKLRQR